MNLAELIVSARACLAASERQYAHGKKGDVAESLASLSVTIQNNLAGADFNSSVSSEVPTDTVEGGLS